MKIKSILASAAACAIAVSAMAITAFAGEMPIQNGTESDGKYAYSVLDNLPQGRTASEVFGAKVVISGVDTEAGGGGGIIFQSESHSWDQKEWGNEGSGKDCMYNYTDFTFTRLESASPFSDSDTWAQVVLSQWDGWGNAVKVESVTLLDKDGNPLGAAAAETTTAADTTAAAAATTTKAANNSAKTNEPSSKTGDAGAALAIAGLVSAGAAAYLVRRKH